MDVVTELISKIVTVFVDLAGNVLLPPEFDQHLTKFVAVIIAVSTKVIQNGLVSA